MDFAARRVVHTRERRKQEQAALIRRFEDDKRKVNAMKEKRGKFKPET